MNDTDDRALIDALPRDLASANGVPDESTQRARERAADLVRAVLGGVIVENGFRWSPCGPGWSSDLDVHVGSMPDDECLHSVGWRRLDLLLGRIGSRGDGRWAVRDAGTTLGAVDLHVGPVPDPLTSVLSRARRRGEVRLREVLELRQLVREGFRLPAGDEVVAAAAAAEASLGGRALAGFRVRPPAQPPVVLRGGRYTGAIRRRVATAVSRRLDVAVSGVDGSGKSSLTAAVATELRAAGIPVTIVWARPGLHLEFLRRPAGLFRRILGHPPEPGLRRVAGGDDDDFFGRRGAPGWVWSLFLTVAFLADVHRQRLAARGVVLHDRHEMDALATLQAAYPDTSRRLQEAIIRRFLPRAEMTFYLEIDVATALTRKPADIFGEEALAGQLDRYAAELPRLRGVTVIDGRAPRTEQVETVLHQLLAP